MLGFLRKFWVILKSHCRKKNFVMKHLLAFFVGDGNLFGEDVNHAKNRFYTMCSMRELVPNDKKCHYDRKFTYDRFLKHLY